MPYVNIPKDLSDVEGRLLMGMSKRQMIAALLIVVVFFPAYFVLRKHIGQLALVLLIVFSAPPFLWAAIKPKDGRRIERRVMNYIRVRWLLPQIRPYRTENIYSALEYAAKIEEVIDDANAREAEAENNKANRPLRKPAKGRKKKDNPND